MSDKIFGMGFAHFTGFSQEYFNNLIETGLNNGVTYFEACSFYNNNKCESQLAQSLNLFTNRNKILLADKLSYNFCLQEFNGNLENYFNYQLKSCKTNYFDYYLIQYVDKRYFNKNNEPNEIFINQYNFLLNKKKEGKIKNIGFIFHSYPENFEECFKIFQWDCVQFSLNYYKWKYGYAKDLYKIATKYNVPIIAMEPLATGYLAQPHSIKQAELYFLMALNNVKIILHGTTNPYHIQGNLFTTNFFKKFKESDLKLLDNFLDYQYKCDCKECNINCPNNFNLKEIINNYNNKSSKRLDKQKYYAYFEPYIQEIKNCQNCSICTEQCTNNIDVKKILCKGIFSLRI